MKAIQSVSVWVNGQQQTANMFNLYIVNDNLLDSATFYYELVDQVITPGVDPNSDDQITNITLASGNASLQGQEYIDWGSSTDINDDAYTLIADQLNLVII